MHKCLDLILKNQQNNSKILNLNSKTIEYNQILSYK